MGRSHAMAWVVPVVAVITMGRREEAVPSCGRSRTSSTAYEGGEPHDTLMVMCRSGGRGAMAVNLLAQAGFKQVYNVTDGMEGDTVEDPEQRVSGPAARERLEEFGPAVDLQGRSGPAGASGETMTDRRSGADVAEFSAIIVLGLIARSYC